MRDVIDGLCVVRQCAIAEPHGLDHLGNPLAERRMVQGFQIQVIQQKGYAEYRGTVRGHFAIQNQHAVDRTCEEVFELHMAEDTTE